MSSRIKLKFEKAPSALGVDEKRFAAPTLSSHHDILVNANLVTWSTPCAYRVTNPREWSKTSKYTATLLLSLLAFVALAASTMIAPALPLIAADLTIRTLHQLSSPCLASSCAMVSAPCSGHHWLKNGEGSRFYSSAMLCSWSLTWDVVLYSLRAR